MKTSMSKGIAFILIVALLCSISSVPQNGSIGTSSVYAAPAYAEIDLSDVSNDISIKCSGAGIWVNTKSALNNDYIEVGDVDDTKLILRGTLNSTSSSITVDSDQSNGSVPINIVFDNVCINNEETATTSDPQNAFEINDTSVDLELASGSVNHISVAALYGSGIQIGNDTDLTITGSGFLSAVMTDDNSRGSGIGGGYKRSELIEINNIAIGGGAEVSAGVGYGAGIGGGFSATSAGISVGSINIADSIINTDIIKEGAGVGGGHCWQLNTLMKVGNISIDNISMSSDIGAGAGIGSGVVRLNNAKSIIDNINIRNSSIDISIGTDGCGIGGGGLIGMNSLLHTGMISIYDSDVDVELEDGAGIGGGYCVNSDTKLSVDHIKIIESQIYAKVDGIGAGIGGGYTYDRRQVINVGSIDVFGSTIESYIERIGAGIGGGYTYIGDNQVNVNEINIVEGVITSSVRGGAVIGGGYSYGTSLINVNMISISDSEVSGSLQNDGAGIGGGATAFPDSHIGLNKISVDKSNIGVSAKKGAGIGAGFTDYYSSSLSTISIDISDSTVEAEFESGAGIGGGYTSDNDSPVTVGSIHVSGSKINSVLEVGAGIGCGAASHQTSPVSFEQIILEGGFITSKVTRWGQDIGTGNYTGTFSNQGKVIISGGSIFAGTDSIEPAPIDKDGSLIYRVTVPAIDSERGKDVTVDVGGYEYRAMTVSSNEHGDTLPASVGAFIYLPAAETSYINITVGSLNGRADVVANPSELQNHVLIDVMYGPVSIAPLTLSMNVGDSSSIQVEYTKARSWYEYIPEINWSVSPAGIVTLSSLKGEEITVFGIAEGDAEITVRIGDEIEVMPVDVSKRVFPFTDVLTSFWGRSAIEFVYFNDLMKGVTDTLFKPNDPMLRSMFVTVVGRVDGNADGAAVTKFADVPQNSYYANHVKWGTENDIIKGITETKFAPNNKITREQVATIIVRYAEYLNIPLTTSGFVPYADFDQVSNYAGDAVMKAQVAGIMTGKPGNNFAPKANITRAEAAQMLNNFKEKIS